MTKLAGNWAAMAGVALSISLGAGCGEDPGADGTGEAPPADATSTSTASDALTLLAEHKDGERSVAFYRTTAGTLLMSQNTPFGQMPLLGIKTMRGRLPSVAFANLTHNDPPSALVDIERELGMTAAAVAPVDRETETKVAALAAVPTSTHVWFRDNFCDSNAEWEAFRTSRTPYEQVKYQYYWSDQTANRQVAYSRVMFGYSAVLNTGTGAVTNKVLIDDGKFAQGGVVTMANYASQWVGWSNENKSCDWFGNDCFYVWNMRKFTLGAVAVDPGDRVDVCGFSAGE